MQEKCKECIWRDEVFNYCMREENLHKKCKKETMNKKETEFELYGNKYKAIQFQWVNEMAEKSVAKLIYKNDKLVIHSGYGGSEYSTKEDLIDWVQIVERLEND